MRGGAARLQSRPSSDGGRARWKHGRRPNRSQHRALSSFRSVDAQGHYHWWDEWRGSKRV